MPKGLLVGYKLADGACICFICAHKPEQAELMKSSRETREVMFRSDCPETRCPKCIICKTRMVDVDLSVLHKDNIVVEDDDEAPKKSASPKKKTASAPKNTPKKRGRKPKATTELYYGDVHFSEPPVKEGVAPKRHAGRPKGSKNKPKKLMDLGVKRGRGRPKGSKNKPKAVA